MGIFHQKRRIGQVRQFLEHNNVRLEAQRSPVPSHPSLFEWYELNFRLELRLFLELKCLESVNPKDTCPKGLKLPSFCSPLLLRLTLRFV